MIISLYSIIMRTWVRMPVYSNFAYNPHTYHYDYYYYYYYYYYEY